MSTRVYVAAGHETPSKDGRHGGGVYRCGVDDGKWERLTGGLPADARVRAVAVHPRDSRVIYAGTLAGPYRSADGGDSWRRLVLPDGEWEVWSVLFDPQRPDVVYAGTGPPAVFRSDDGGDTWTRLPGFRDPGHVKASFACRVTRLAADPSAPHELYAGLEVGGVLRSLDGGARWDDASADLLKLAERPHLRSRIVSDTEAEGMMDSHALCVSSARPGTVWLAVRMGLFRSADRGTTWEDMEVGRFSPLTYARDVQVSPHDPATLYACLSPAARSEAGSLYRSDDLGQSWRRFDHDVTARSTMMALGLHRRDPGQVYCATRQGQVFGTRDAGRTWQEYPLPAGTGDVYAVACA
jgi:photosystem II stability/assembly factor-like uncharacterized protein